MGITPTSPVVIGPQTAEGYRAPQQAGSAPIGRSGMSLSLWGKPRGWEPNQKLADGRWWRERVPRMRVCPPVDTGSQVQTDLLLSATVQVGGSDPDPDAAEWMRRQWGLEGRSPEMTDTFEDALRRMTRSVHEGAACFEWVTKVGADGRIYLDRLHDRHMSSIIAYLTDETEQLVGVRQMVTLPGGTVEYRDIPIRQLLHLAYRMRGATDFDGHGLWRAVQAEAADYSEVGQLLVMGARRFALGEIEVEIDLEAANLAGVVTGDAATWMQAEQERAAMWASRRHSTEDAHLARPSWWRANVIETSKGYNPDALVRQRTHYAEVILQALGAEFLMVAGTQAAGAYSAAETKVARAQAAAQNVLDWLLSQVDAQVNAQLLATNFPGLEPGRYPKLVASGLSAKTYVGKLADVLNAIDKKAITWTPGDEDALRRDLELPDLTDEARARAEERGNTP